MSQKPLRVGFDLDGVILYNPARIVRPILSFIKHDVFHKKSVSFYVPKTKTEQLMWTLAHKTSIFPAYGFRDLKKLIRQHDIEAYIVTGRFNSLKNDFNHWLNRMNADSFFTDHFHNEKNEQPHLFKKRMIEQLNLDVFVEDNYDIVTYLNKELKNTKVLWIYNFLDRTLPYPYKFPHLKHAIDHIKKDLKKGEK
ncbi:hypothetical protein HGA88_02140 [Candidatus Roizmanbacteria bacterium]|nr:hypothetical protein [Candidatus Roizmanbacteria bacterium]